MGRLRGTRTEPKFCWGEAKLYAAVRQTRLRVIVRQDGSTRLLIVGSRCKRGRGKV